MTSSGSGESTHQHRKTSTGRRRAVVVSSAAIALVGAVGFTAVHAQEAAPSAVARSELQLRPVLVATTGSPPTACPSADPTTIPDPNRPLVACTRDGELLQLGPAQVAGADAIDAAAAEPDAYAPGTWLVHITFRSAASTELARMTDQLHQLEAPHNRMAILRGDSVLSAPQIRATLTTGDIPVAGNFTQPVAEDVAHSLQP